MFVTFVHTGFLTGHESSFNPITNKRSMRFLAAMRRQRSSSSVFQDGLMFSMKTLLFLFILTWLVVTIHSDEDYYKLLGISREASTREIRQAFKKLALTMHPDKNPNDETAHEKFLKINRAYEVLKDEDLRKKYDKYGEKGLQDEQQGGRYESWNYYRYDFGEFDNRDDHRRITDLRQI
ncbi:dnaJ homolog subfamily C member 10 isoform X1 [Tachysurus ichikawai]